MVVENEFQSQPSPIIHYTYNKILEGLRCCELPKSVQTHSWGKKWRRAKPTLTPPVTAKHVAVTIIEHIYQSQPSPTIHYTYNKKLKGLRWCDILWSSQNTQSCCEMFGARSENCHHQLLKAGVWWWLSPYWFFFLAHICAETIPLRDLRLRVNYK